MKTLDRSKPFAEVWGGSVKHRYEQDGRKFDGSGNEIGEPGAAAPAPAAASAPADGPAVEAAKMLDGSADKIIPELADVSDELLAALRAGEEAGKTRKGVMAAIDAEIAQRAVKSTSQADAQLEG